MLRTFIINLFSNIFIGNKTFALIKSLIIEVDKLYQLPSEDKRKMVIDAYLEQGYPISNFLLNLGIELGVLYLKARSGLL